MQVPEIELRESTKAAALEAVDALFSGPKMHRLLLELINDTDVMQRLSSRIATLDVGFRGDEQFDQLCNLKRDLINGICQRMHAAGSETLL